MTDALLQLIQICQDMGRFGLAVLGVACIIAAMVFVPRPAICILSGLVYGLMIAPLVLIASTIGSAFAFLLARYVFQEQFLRRVESRPVLQAIVRAMDQESWRVVGLLRLGSPLPGSAQSYLFGLTRIGLLPYTFATLVGIAPQVILYVAIGAFGQTALQSGSPLNLAIISLGIVVTALAIALVTKRARATWIELSRPGER